MSVIFRMGFFYKLLFYSDYSSDEMILHLWEWSQHNPEEAGLVFFKLKFSCDCLLKCPCFACEEKLIYVDLSSQNINSTTVVVYKLQAELALRPGLMLLPQVLLLDSYLPGSCAHWQLQLTQTAAFIHKVKKIYIVLILFIYHKCRWSHEGFRITGAVTSF